MVVTTARGPPRPSPTTDGVDTVATTARGPLRPSPTTDGVDTEDTDMARGPLRPNPTTDGVDTVATTARGSLRPSPTTDGVDMVATTARGPLRLSPTTDGVDTVDTDMARGLLTLTTEATAMVATMASVLLMPKPTTVMAAMAHTLTASNCIVTFIHSEHQLATKLTNQNSKFQLC